MDKQITQWIEVILAPLAPVIVGSEGETRVRESLPHIAIIPEDRKKIKTVGLEKGIWFRFGRPSISEKK
jgi:hypothetical protein